MPIGNICAYVIQLAYSPRKKWQGIGGGSDLRACYQSGYGSIVSIAIDKFMYVTVNNPFDTHIRVIYSKAEYVENTI